MAQRVKIMTDEGFREFPVYNDNRELASDFAAGVIWSGVDVIYRSLVCELLCEFIDEDGVKFCELLVKNGLGPNITFSI